MFDRFLPRWRRDPTTLLRSDQIPDALIVEAHASAKAQLTALVSEKTGTALDPKALTIGFARRMTAYKRPALLFSHVDKLREIASAAGEPIQVVLAGKAHPRDSEGKELIASLHRVAGELRGAVTVAFVPGYDMDIARTIVAGVDVWLNTPERPLEASGTSGMKAALNGVPSLSILDGWWIEGCIEGLTGWAIGKTEMSANGDDAFALYDKLEHAVLAV